MRRSRTIAAEPGAVWPLILDPHHQPRWWPGVERMEGVGGAHFTQVLRSSRGRAVRADFTIAELTTPAVGEPGRLAWRQELADSPFARVLSRSVITLTLTASGPGSEVTLVHEQTLRGSSRTGAFLLRRATRRRLDEALAGLAAIV